MFEKVKALRLQYREAQSKAEEEAIQQVLDSLRAEDPEAWAWAMVENAKETAQEAKALKEEVKTKEALEAVLV
jgi:hypothetical protein